MSKITTYDTLLAAVKDWTDTHSGTVIDRQLPTCVQLVESDMRKRLRVGQQEAKAQVTTKDGQSEYALPPQCQELRTVSYFAPGDEAGTHSGPTPLEYLPPSGLDAIKVRNTREVLYYTWRMSKIEVQEVPAAGGLLVLEYLQGIPELGEDMPSNWVLADYPDVYLSGTISEVYGLKRMLSSEEMAEQARWTDKYNAALGDLVTAYDLERWSGPPRRALIRW